MLQSNWVTSKCSSRRCLDTNQHESLISTGKARPILRSHKPKNTINADVFNWPRSTASHPKQHGTCCCCCVDFLNLDAPRASNTSKRLRDKSKFGFGATWATTESVRVLSTFCDRSVPAVEVGTWLTATVPPFKALQKREQRLDGSAALLCRWMQRQTMLCRSNERIFRSTFCDVTRQLVVRQIAVRRSRVLAAWSGLPSPRRQNDFAVFPVLDKG